ncbi:MAG TPA: hypothetical protein VFG69_05600 [Nannocystaceae bacterium]|nr:hypothetical protein [Nannocystaceae bacterium]
MLGDSSGKSLTIAIALVGCGGGTGNGDGGSESADDASGPDDGPVDDSADDAPAGDTASSDPGGTADDSADDGSATDDSADGSETGLPDDVEIWELRAGGFEPPATETHYSCFSFTFPVDQLHHIVGFAPKVTSPIIHHYVLSLADAPVELNPADSCVEWPAHILWAWGPGGEEIMLPEEAGFLVGHQGPDVTFILQVHYNNPLQMPLVDNDGVDLHVTKALRPNRAGIFSQGDIFSILIPPGDPAYEHVATCGGEITQSIFTEQPRVFASFLHAHQIGSVMYTEVRRGGELIGEIARQDPFSFAAQMFQTADFELMAGDTLQTHCVYDSTSRAGVTMGGPASDEEMCINFMMYYPWIPSETCGAL